MRAPSRRNPLVLAGLGVIGVTAVSAALASAPARTAAIQSVLPVAIGGVLIALGWLLDDELPPATYRRRQFVVEQPAQDNQHATDGDRQHRLDRRSARRRGPERGRDGGHADHSEPGKNQRISA